MEIKLGWLPKKRERNLMDFYDDAETYNEAISDCSKAIEENLPSEEELFNMMQEIHWSVVNKMYAKAIRQRLVNGKGF